MSARVNSVSISGHTLCTLLPASAQTITNLPITARWACAHFTSASVGKKFTRGTCGKPAHMC